MDKVITSVLRSVVTDKMNRSQELHPLKASFKINTRRTREHFVAGSSSRFPKIFPSAHRRTRGNVSVVELPEAGRTVMGRVPSNVLHTRVKSWKGIFPFTDLRTSSDNHTTAKLLQRKARSRPLPTDKSTFGVGLSPAVTGNLLRVSFNSNFQSFTFSQSVTMETNSID